MTEAPRELMTDDVITLQELFIASIAINDALLNLLIRKGVITRDELTNGLFFERAKYDKLLNRTVQ